MTPPDSILSPPSASSLGASSVAARRVSSRNLSAKLLAIESVVPPYTADVDLATAAAQAMSCGNDKEAEMVAKLYRRTGVQTRGSVLLERDGTTGHLGQSFYPHASESSHGPTTAQRNERFAVDGPRLAVAAGHAAIRSSGCLPSDITHLITVTCTGFYSPGIDIELIESLDLPVTTERIQIGFMGCHALINAMRTARGLTSADRHACVLIVSVELCSLHYQYGYNAQRIVSGSLFADGASGAIVVGSEYESTHDLVDPDSSDTPAQIVATGSCLIPGSRDAMTWTIGDHGFVMTLSASVPALIEEHLHAYLSQWLAKQGESIESIGGWAVHPGGTRILTAVQTALGLSDEHLEISREVLRQHGNMSSATLGAVLQRFGKHSIPRPWLMLGFGPGLEIEVALLR
ncbi:type III polyketide synthase [Neorhodopirellula pilleata]|uniref:Alpha-pyrone synthesis polyketide synthase-like Pks11 n=1 Tax=Neorhodopirellula pilleata TaxID=2714738 RepID=A0A5C6A0S0_9BACT|nr:type III polyketide synthase [Neorhodopirellula pilleata]TWT93016.1 Alpha-pyrone synthesis polyketide synthase-like Pks11 [Neorhodopirellula pilleata]